MINGIDVSKWQGAVDWAAARASGVAFAMIKAANGSNRGTYSADPRFEENIRGAYGAGIAVGVYLYSYALSVEAARDEAEYLIRLIEPYRGLITYPAAYDLEDDTQRNLGRATLSEMARVFCGAVRAAGYRPMLYTNPDWLSNRVDVPQGADLWLAHWGASAPARACAIWQKSDQGSVPGITGAVDLNIGYLDYAAQEEQEEQDMARYNTLDEMPAWARETIEKVIRLGILRGDGSVVQGQPAGLDLSHDMVRMFVFNDRAGLYG